MFTIYDFKFTVLEAGAINSSAVDTRINNDANLAPNATLLPSNITSEQDPLIAQNVTDNNSSLNSTSRNTTDINST